MSGDIGAKVQHVLAQRGAGDHHCHWPDCPELVPPARWGCRKHWYLLPKELRSKIWFAYKPGQEITKTPSAKYLVVAREVQEWIAGFLLHCPRFRCPPRLL